VSKGVDSKRKKMQNGIRTLKVDIIEVSTLEFINLRFR